MIIYTNNVNNNIIIFCNSNSTILREARKFIIIISFPYGLDNIVQLQQNWENSNITL